MRRALVTIATGSALVAAGCGEDGGGASGSATSTTPAQTAPLPTTSSGAPRGEKSARPGARVRVVNSQFGRVVADRHGEALYLFDAEHGKPECYGDCARAWPPFLTKGTPRAPTGARAELLGTTRRRDGKLQVTYRGHPLYYYVSDSPGQILCQDVEEFGGTWLVVQPNGEPVR